MKLYEALQQVIGEYGITVIRERRLAGLLSGLGVLGSAGIRKVMEAFAADGCGKAFGSLQPGESGTDIMVQAESIKEILIRDHGFSRSDTDYAIDSLTYALGLRDMPPDALRSGPPASGEDAAERILRGSVERHALWQHSWDDTETSESCRRAAEGGDSDAQFWLGLAYRYGHGVRQDCREAVRWLLKSADQGDARAQAELGDLCSKGIGVTQDYGEAEKWFQKAAEQGNTDAENNLGFLYIRGLGVRPDYKKAFDWFMKAASHGEPTAVYNIGRMYAEGAGVEADSAEAVKWYRKAADLGNADAQNNLGNMYSEGNGVRRDPGEAFRWYMKAAEQGCAAAEINLGRMYEDGDGVSVSFAKAVK